MNATQLAQEIGSLWSALNLAAQGAFTNAHPANGHKSLTAARDAFASFTEARAVAIAAMERLMRAFGSRITNPAAVLEANSERAEAMASINQLVAQLESQLVRAIRTGTTVAPAAMLPNAHGAIGELIGKNQGILQVTVRDDAGRQWKDSRRLVETIARGAAVQIAVIGFVSEMRDAGHTHAYIGGVEHPLLEIAAMRTVFFHPNSKELPRVDLHA